MSRTTTRRIVPMARDRPALSSAGPPKAAPICSGSSGTGGTGSGAEAEWAGDAESVRSPLTVCAALPTKLCVGPREGGAVVKGRIR